MSWYFVIKCIVSGIVVGLVSEIARWNSGFAAIIASLPLTSILALIWLYAESGDAKAVAELSMGIGLVVLPSLAFFALFTVLIRLGWSFWPVLGSSIAAMSAIYCGYVWILGLCGIKMSS